MTLTQLRFLVAIADAGLNITQAAERVFATQPGLSKQLKRLEDELGCQLFSRKGKSLDAITPAGRQVLEHARSILTVTANIRAVSSNLRETERGELRLATTHTQARFVLPPVVAKLKQRYPEVSVHVHPGGDRQILDSFESGDVDLAITSSVGAPPDFGLALPVYCWQRVILVPRGHALTTTGRAPTLAELAQYPLVSYDSSLREDSSLRRAFNAQGLTPSIAITAADADLIKTYVRTGLGVGVLAEMAVRPEDLSDLVELPAAALFPACTTWLLLPRNRVVPHYLMAFIALFAPHIPRRDLDQISAQPVTQPVWPQALQWNDAMLA